MRIIYLLSFLTTAFILSSCNADTTSSSVAAKSKPAATQQKMVTKTGLIHTVFFWMKDGFDADKKARFEAGLKNLEKTPSIKEVFWGPPAMTEREVVDNSYDYAWIVHFASKEDEAKYQVDPLHLPFIEECKDLWEKVVVYDSLVK